MNEAKCEVCIPGASESRCAKHKRHKKCLRCKKWFDRKYGTLCYDCKPISICVSCRVNIPDKLTYNNTYTTRCKSCRMTRKPIL